MTNFSNTINDDEIEREWAIEDIIKAKSPADAAQEIIKTIIAPLVESLEESCPNDCDRCRD